MKCIINRWCVNLMLGLSCMLLLVSASDSTEIILWHEDQKLSWRDFEGMPRHDYENLAALTSSGISYYTGCKEGQLIYKIESYFDKQESWVKLDAMDSHKLEHEQIHFDITELFARKLRKLLAQRTFTCYELMEFQQIVDTFLNNWETEQRIYDIHSSYSRDVEVQKEWLQKVAFELEAHEDFK